MPSENLRRRLAKFPWPTPDQTETDPAPGDLWAATWEGARALVFVLDASQDSVTVAGATSEVTGDEHTLIVSTESSPVPGAGIHIWAGLRAMLPRRAFENRLGANPQLIPKVLEAAKSPPSLFPPIVDVLDPRAERRAALMDALEALARARWQPEAQSRLRDLLPGLRPSGLAGLIGLTPGDAEAVLNGARSLTIEQAERIAVVYAEVTVDDLIAATAPRLPDNVVSLLERPRRLRRIRQRAVRSGRTEPQVMREDLVPLQLRAARTTGHVEPDWEALIDDALSD